MNVLHLNMVQANMTCVRLTRLKDWTDSMKFRQGLIASATAAAVLTSGVTAANAEEATPTTTAVSTPTTTPTVTTAPKPTQTTDQKDSSSLKDMDPREVKEWIAVAAAIIALLGSIYTFADRYFLK